MNVVYDRYNQSNKGNFNVTFGLKGGTWGILKILFKAGNGRWEKLQLLE
jgi:hypothetical protein